MPTPRPQTTAYAPVLLAVKAKLLADVLPGGYVNVGTADGFGEGYNAERFVSLRPSGVMTSPAAGGGRHYKPMRRLLSVTLATRLALDVSGDAEAVWADPLYGHLWFEEAVFAALDLFAPLHPTAGTPLLYEPMRHVEADGDAAPTAPPADGFLVSVQVYETRYGFPFVPSV